jgi:uncharacterized OsmC-like protein
MKPLEITVGAGSLRADGSESVAFSHRWTEAGVTVEAQFTGAHLLHLAVAGCVLNDLYREAAALGISLKGARVRASGDFDTTTWASTGIEYAVDVDTEATDDEVSALIERVDDVAEIPRAIRHGASVKRVRDPA